MRILSAALGGFVLDLLLGDPAWLTPIHPVVLMGRCISALEKRLRVRFPRTPEGERRAGRLLAAILPLGTLLLCWGILSLLDRLWAPLGFALRLIWCWQALAIKNLKDESMKVCHALENEGLEAARAAVSRIVGRDTARLDEAGVARAAVETVAENFADGVIAPLFYMLLGGAPLALACKAVNTMDSMLGYKNERYLHFGRAAAKLDDAVNFLPARLAALLLIGVSFLLGEDGKNAWRIWRRDRHKHPSPNSAQCESAMAGALGLRLLGPAWYFGEYQDKAWIGEEKKPIDAGDIRRACRLLYAGSAAGLLVFGLIRLLLLR